MKKFKNISTLAVILAMAVGTLAGCSGGTATSSETSPSSPDKAQESASAEPSGKPDTITALLPPVSTTYQEQFDRWVQEFEAENSNLKLQVDKASWEDMKSKLDVQVQAGSPPDIAFIGCDVVPKYLDTGLLVDISKYASQDMLADFDSNMLGYFKNGDGIYGMPAYMEVQCLGGEQGKLEAAGIDWKKVQQDGWTYEEFRKAVQSGTVDNNGNKTYGFVFASAGVTAKDYLSIFAKNAGMPSPFTTDMKYAYTSKNMLNLLTDLRQLIDDGSMPDSLNTVDGGMRWNMFLTGKTMIFGKGLSIFENVANANNKKIEANDGSAVADSQKTSYIVLPVPTFFGNPQQAQGIVDGYVAFKDTATPSDEHLANVAKAMYFFASGERAAFASSELFLTPNSKSAEAVFKAPEGKNVDNTNAVEKLVTQAAPARPDIPGDLGAKAEILMDQTIVPKFQSMLAGEATPQQVYDAIVSAATTTFGEDGIVKD